MTEARSQGYIPEIVGLRGLALSLVVVFHVFGQGRVSGGVDVFLFLSGFLLTWAFIRRAANGGEISLPHRYARIAQRLIPAALIVLSAVVVATIAFLPRHRWLQVGREVLASALYYENWELIGSQLSYGAAGPSASPLQHFWSMSVQGQFFLVWPVVLLLMTRLVKRRDSAIAPLVLLVSVALTVFSLGLSQWMHSVDQGVNYLHSATRMWQLTLGASLAAVLPSIRIASPVRSAVAWAGLSMVTLSGFLIDGAAHFPSYPALMPVLGAALVVVGAGPDHRFSVQRVLLTKPVKFLADISYPLYLWHWPLMVIFMQYRGAHVLGLKSATAVLMTSLVLAWLTQHIVNRLVSVTARRASSQRTLLRWLAILTLFAISVGASVGTLHRWEERELAALPQGVSPYNPGALVLSGKANVPAEGWAAPPIPSLTAAQRDTPEVYSEGCIQDHRDGPGFDEVLVCADEEKAGSERTIVMSGGSHVLHWHDALRTVADRNGWRLFVVDKDGCRLRLPNPQSNAITSCDRWNNAALDTILGLEPDAVFTVGTRTPGEPGLTESIDDRQIKAWEFLSEHGVPTIAIRDTPRFLERVPDCIARVGIESAEQCGRSEADIYRDINPLDLIDLPHDTAVLDMRHAFCAQGDCGVYIGNVLAYRDHDHMTATYSATLANDLELALSGEVPWLFEPN